MITIILTLSVYFAIACIAAILYIPKFRQIAGAKIVPQHYIAKEKRRIGIIIPARDESSTIGDLLHSIQQQSYDKNYFDVFVIVKDFNDPTVTMSKEIGAKTYVCENQKYKGDALHYFFENLPQADFKLYDAFVIVDADAILSKDYVTELNNALESNAHIYVSRKLIKNFLVGGKHSIICSCSSLLYPINDDLGNRYRAKNSIPLNICGQGLMLRREVIEKKNGWNYLTITEDYELKMDSLLQDFKTEYCHYAVIYTEEVLTHKESYKRRLRWLTGISQSNKLYGKQVKEKLKFNKELKKAKFDFLHFSDAIFLFIIDTALTVISGLVLTVYYAVHHNIMFLPALLLLAFLPMALLYIVLFGFTVIALNNYKDAFIAVSRKNKIKTLLFMPLFLLEFIPLFIQGRLCSCKNTDWKKTERISFENGEIIL